MSNNLSRRGKRKAKNGTQRVSAVLPRAPIARGRVPGFTGLTNGIRVAHRELVGTLTNGSTSGWYVDPLNAAVPGYDLTPGCSVMFPWLSAIALRYERYAFRKLSIRLLPQNPTINGGRVYMCVDYDYTDLPAHTQAEVLSNVTSTSGNVWEDLTLECDPGALMRDMPYKYTHNASRVPVEMRSSYSGYVQFFVNAQTQTDFDIMVDYVVDLITPQLDHADVDSSWAEADTQPFVSDSGIDRTFPPPVRILSAPTVVPGTNTTPGMKVTVAGTEYDVPFAYDLANNRTGVLDFKATVDNDAALPADYLAVSRETELMGYDGFGNNVTSGAIPLTDGMFVSTKYGPSEGMTLGEPVSTMFTIFIRKLVETFPTIRYIVPVLNLGGSGTYKTDVHTLFEMGAVSGV